MCVLRAANVFFEAFAELIRECEQDFILVVDRVLENLGYKFVACAIEALPLNI